MYINSKKNIIKKILQNRGLSILELTVSCIVFSLLLIGVYATLDIGLKSWQLGATRSDLNQRAEVVLNRIVKDFRQTNLMTVQMDNDLSPVTGYRQYICLETPIDIQSGLFEPDKDNVGNPLWQGYILYYIYPRLPDNGEKALYKRFISRGSVSIPLTSSPTRLPNYSNYINSTSTGTDSYGAISRVAGEIYNIDFNIESSKLTVKVCFKKDIRKNSSVAFSGSGKDDLGIEVLEFKASVNPRN